MFRPTVANAQGVDECPRCGWQSPRGFAKYSGIPALVSGELVELVPEDDVRFLACRLRRTPVDRPFTDLQRTEKLSIAINLNEQVFALYLHPLRDIKFQIVFRHLRLRQQ